MRFIIPSIIILFVIVESCYYDSQEYLYPQITPNTCDTSNVTYTYSVKPILEKYCTLCHYTGASFTTGNGIILDNYTDAKKYTEDGSLLGAIKHTAASPMPKPLGSPKLDDCKIATFEIWKRNLYPQ
jgi:hypothetical protein